MTTEEQVFLIPKIRSGIVIDHIPSGLGLRLVEIIRSYPGMASVVTSVGFNYSSQKLGKKDLIKLQTDDLDERILQHISLVSPGISIVKTNSFSVSSMLVLGSLCTGESEATSSPCILGNAGNKPLFKPSNKPSNPPNGR